MAWEAADRAICGEVVERDEGRVEGAGVVGVGVEETGGHIVFAVKRRSGVSKVIASLNDAIRLWSGRGGGNGANLLCAYTSFQSFNLFGLFGILLDKVRDALFLKALGFGELGGLGLEGFDAAGKGVEDVGFLVGACHCLC